MTMKEIKAIETRYKGYRFRSRLEARWAVFFDALGVKWEYEAEGFAKDGVGYLPDFWLPDVGEGCFVEIKPQDLSDDEVRKVQMLATSGKHVMAFVGNPWPGECRISHYRRKPSLAPEFVAVIVQAARDGKPWLANYCDWRKYWVPEFTDALIASKTDENFYKWYVPVNRFDVALAYCRFHRYFFW